VLEIDSADSQIFVGMLILFQTRYSELFAGPCAKVKGTIYAEVEPSSSNLRWEEQFSKDLMDNPR